MLVEGAEELPEEQLLAMAERAIKEAKSVVGELVKRTFTELLKTTNPNESRTDRSLDNEDSITFEDFANALSRVPLEQKLSIRFPN